MKSLLVLIVTNFCLLIPKLHCQNKNIDSLKAVLQTQKEDTNKVKTYYELIKIVRLSDFDGARKLAGEQLVLSKKLGYLWGIGKAYNSLGLIEKILRHFDLSRDYFANAAKVFLAAKDYASLVGVYINIAENYAEMDSGDSSIYYCKVAEKFNQFITNDSTKKLSNEMTIYGSMGQAFFNMHIIDSTLFYNNKSIRIAVQTGNKRELAEDYIQAANVYQVIAQNEKALPFLQMALDIFKAENNEAQVVLTESALAVSYYSMGKYDSTLFYSRQSMDLSKKIKDSAALIQNYLSMGLASAGLKKFDDALYWYNEGFAAPASLKSQGTEYQLHEYLGETMHKLKHYDSAIYHFNMAMKIADPTDNKAIYECSNKISLSYEELNDYKNALLYERKGRAAEKLFFDSTQAKMVNDFTVKYETGKKEQQIQLLSTENKLGTALARQESQRKNFAYTGIALILLSAGYGFYRFRKRKKIQSQQEILNERLRISRELHDDIASTLGSISIYSEVAKNRSLKNENAGEAISKIGVASRELIDKMSDIVWSINPDNEGFEQLKNRMQVFAAIMLTPHEIVYNFYSHEEVKNLNLTAQVRKNIYLIYKEAIHNIVKYAACSQAEIRMSVNDNQFFMYIKDNGKGFDVNSLQQEESLGGNGIKNMKARAESMNAYLYVTSKLNEGTMLELKLNS